MLFPDQNVALVTGSSRGIGAAIALDLAAEGAAVIVNYHTNADAAACVVKEIEANGGRALAVQADVANEADVRRLFRTARTEFGGLNVLVNNAGVIGDGFVMMMSDKKWDRVMRTNMTSTFLCTREGLKLMARNSKTARPGGVIVNIASIAGIIGTAGQLNYSAAKGAMISFTRGLALEAAPMKVRANCVAPGFIETDMARSAPPAVLESYAAVTPLKRIGRADEVASLVSFLASEKASYITGQTIAIDGGYVTQ